MSRSLASAGPMRESRSSGTSRSAPGVRRRMPSSEATVSTSTPVSSRRTAERTSDQGRFTPRPRSERTTTQGSPRSFGNVSKTTARSDARPPESVTSRRTEPTIAAAASGVVA